MNNALLGWMSKQELVVSDLPDNLTSNQKLLADDRSLFSTVTDPNVTANQINNDLHSISTWAHQ